MENRSFTEEAIQMAKERMRNFTSNWRNANHKFIRRIHFVTTKLTKNKNKNLTISST